jgi:phosphohistidine phosphatase
MQIFLLRHGQAESQKTTDDARELTSKGRSDVSSAVVLSLADLKGLCQIWVSPLVRAHQTATIVSDILGQHDKSPLLKTTGLLVPEADPIVLLDAIEQENARSILLVSHQPLVGKVIDLLCGVNHAYYPMHTSSMASFEQIDLDVKKGRLCWLRHVNE